MKTKLLFSVVMVMLGFALMANGCTPAAAQQITESQATPTGTPGPLDQVGTQVAQTQVWRDVTATWQAFDGIPTETAMPTATQAAPTQAATQAAQPTQAAAASISQPTLQPAGTQVATTIGMPAVTSEQQVNGWSVQFFDGATGQMYTWANSLRTPVNDWSEFPNVDFPQHDFLARDGVEYGMAESAYCQQQQLCDVNTPAMHYRLITGDYNIPGIDQCSGSVNGTGCGIAIFNVGNVTAMWRDSHVDYGFTVEGRYWNGDAMPTTIWALMSNTSYLMLNEAGDVNMGANCSVPSGCVSVRLTVVIVSGNQLLMRATTFVSK